MRFARSLLVFFLLSGPLLAHAQSAAESIQQGLALREQGRDEEALALFQRAYQDDGSGEALAQVALAEQALGRLVEAEAHLASALAETEDRFVRRHRAALQSALDEVRGGLGDLRIAGGTPGAEVWIDDASRGVLPLAGPIRVPLGTVRVELRSAGSVISESSVEVVAGEMATLTASLEPTPGRAPDPVPVSDPVAREPEPVTAGSPTSASVLLPVGIGVAALGVVLAGVATGLMVVREDSARARLSCVDTDPACRAHFQTALDAEGAGVALYVTSVALVGAGAVLVMLDVLGQDAGESSAFACAPGALSVSCRGRF